MIYIIQRKLDTVKYKCAHLIYTKAKTYVFDRVHFYYIKFPYKLESYLPLPLVH